MKNVFIKTRQEYRSLLLFILLMLSFRSSLADWNHVPTGSMQPTIVEGDRILVNKIAYDLRVPFIQTSIVKIADPQRGDIVVFNSPTSKQRLVKRIIGLPNDLIALRNNELFINGQKLDYQNGKQNGHNLDKIENLLGLKHVIRVNLSGSRLANFTSIQVPKNSYLALGNNRDNSADSRVIGFVPRDQILGRTQRVLISLDYENYYMPRSERFFKTL